MNRRTAITTIGLGTVGLMTACPFDGVTRDRAVKYAGIAIGYLKDISPIASDLGGHDVVELIDRAIPTLEKLKKALEDSEFPSATNLFDTITNLLGQVATALLQLPESARRMQVIAILTLVNITLRTVGLFVETTEMPAEMKAKVQAAANKHMVTPDAMMKAFEATRF